MNQLKSQSVADRSCRAQGGVVRRVMPALLFAHILGGNALCATDDALPKAEVILDKAVEVTGGVASYARIHNRVIKGTIDFVGLGGITAPITVYAAKPNKARTIIQTEALGRMEDGNDGKIAWELMAMSGPRVKGDEETAVSVRLTTLDAGVEWRQFYKNVECVGVETVNDTPCYKVVATPHVGKPEMQYFDKRSGLLLRADVVIPHPMGSLPSQMYAGDYKKVDGILLPHTIRQIIAGQEHLIKVNTIEHNVQIPSDWFDLPPEVQALVDREKDDKEPKKGTD